MKSTQIVMISGIILSVLANNAFAKTSAMNANIRLFEDTLWLVAFLLMMVAGFLLRRLSGTGGSAGYWVLGIAGLVGSAWKGIGVIKRIFVASEPKWLFDLTRETLEGLSGVILAVAFILLVLSIRRVYSRAYNSA